MSKLGNYIERIRRMDAGIAENAQALASLRRELATVARSAEIAGAAASITARRQALHGPVTRVVVLVHNPTVWASLDELVRLMTESDDFEPIVISIPHHYAGEGPSHGEAEVHDMLDAAGIDHLRITDEAIGSASTLLRALTPDIVIRQSQWDQDVDEAFRADNLAWARTVHISYGAMNVIENAPWGDPPVNSAVDTDWHRACWLVFVANDIALRIAQRDGLIAGRQFRAVGHPKGDAIRATEPAWPIPAGDGARRRRVAWSAHHSILTGWNDFGLFPATCDDMLAWARESSDVEFAYFHHPMLLQTIDRPGGPISRATYDAWLAEWTALPNTAYWTGHYAQALAAADVVVTDGPSVLSESQVLGKPVLFLERPGHVAFNEVGTLLAEGVHRLAGVAQARQVFDDLAAGPDPLAQTQRRNIERLYGEPGAAGRILDVLRQEIAAVRAGG